MTFLGETITKKKNMNLQESIRRILRESTFFRRRIDMRLMEKEFFETLNYVTDIFLRKRDYGQAIDFDMFKKRTITSLMDDYHNELSDGGLNDFPYDEVYDFLSNHFHDKIKERYDLILNRNINESVPSQVKRRQQIFDDMFLAKRNSYISCNYRTPEYLFNGLLELTLEELYFGWFVDSVTYEEWEESVKFIESYLTEKYYDETSRMWESKCKGRLYESEDNEGLYLSMIKDIVDPYKTENGVCDIDVNYDQEDDMYTVMVNFGLKQLDKTFHPVRSLQREWHVEDIRNKVKNEILGLLPIENIYVGSTAVENCNETINESEEKNQSLLLLIEQHGLYDFMKMTGLSLKEIYEKTGELPREVFERYIRDFLNEEGYHQTNGSVHLGYAVEIQKNIQIEHFYMEGDKVTVEIRGYNDYNEQTDGYIESLSNLSDEEMLAIVKDMIFWSENS